MKDKPPISCTMPSNSGQKFLVLFIESIVDTCKQDLVITTMSTVDVTVKISAPLRLDLLPQMTTTVYQGNSSLINVASELNVLQTGISNNGILIESDGDITVQGYSQSLSSADGDSTGGFQALPISSLGTEYMVTTYCEEYVCQVAIAAVVDTSVRVQFKLAQPYTLSYNLSQYGDGDVLTVSLKAYQVLQLQIATDMSGTIITSLDKVAVFVGSDWTPIMPWKNDGLGDFMVEQMPPLNTWGCSYVVTSFPGRSSSDLVTIVAAENTAEVTDSSGSTYTIGYRNRHTLNLASGTSLYLSSTSRIIVAQFTMSPERFVTDTDPSMLLVPPIDQWKTSYDFEIIDLTPTNFVTSVTIFANTSCVGLVRLDGNQIPSATWSGIQNTEFSSSTIVLSNQAYRIGTSDVRCQGFSGYIYQKAYKTAMSFALGGYLQVNHTDCMPSVTTSSTTVTSATSTRSVNSILTSEDSLVPTLHTTALQTSNSLMKLSQSSEESVPTTSARALSAQSSDQSPGVSSTSVLSVEALSTSITSSPVETQITSVEGLSTSITSSPVETQITSVEALSTSFTSSPFEIQITSVEVLSTSITSSPVETQITSGQGVSTHDPSTYASETTAPSMATNTEQSRSIDQTVNKTLGEASVASLSTADIITTSTTSITDKMVSSGFQFSSSVPSVYFASSALCNCSCKLFENTWVDVDLLKSALAVDKSILSKTIRKRISIPDDRPSAVTLGWVGIIFIVLILMFLTVPDIFTVLVYVLKPGKKM
ncbi:mucin-22-like [Haliotis rufescens]|uniref:mucin-22-like n=1 Tax=Haliotis rufescens TaxID=6454 RepID=UPI00201F9502|nr:mucin-22-like [Haliotis rufescens]